MTQGGHAEVELKDDIIYCTVSGRVTGEITLGILQKIADFSRLLQQRNQPVRLLTDISRVTKTTSEARSAAKLLGKMKFSQIAVYGRNKFIILIGQYIIKMAGLGGSAKFFRSKTQAINWLVSGGKNNAKSRKNNLSIVFVAGLLVLAIGVIALLGWYNSNEYMTRVIPSLRPMNPMAAVGLLILAGGLFGLWSNHKLLTRTAGILIIILGISALLPLGIDNLIFAEKIKTAGTHTQLADTAAICFMALGVVLSYGKNNRIWRIIRQGLLASTLAVALFNIYGQLYAHDFIYGIGDQFVMALHLAFAFAIISTLLFIIYNRRIQKTVSHLSALGWAIIIAFLVIQLALYLLWGQSNMRVADQSRRTFDAKISSMEQALRQRIEVYNGVLLGFQGFFVASDKVSEGEFYRYYQTLNLKKNYPGLRSIAFIAAVPDRQLSTFTREFRTDKTLLPGGHPTLTIQKKTIFDTHYIVAYSPETPSSPLLGLDLGSIPGRQAMYDAATQSTSNYASEPIIFPSVDNAAPIEGFFITVPVRSEANGTAIGLVNANFSYNDLFAKLFVDEVKTGGIAVKVIDKATAKTVYTTGDFTPDGLSGRSDIVVSNRTFIIQFGAPKNYTLTMTQKYVEWVFLIAGIGFNLFLVWIFVMQARRRQQALDLASHITEDLHHERDEAIAIKDKDDAILSSIGDAVFAIDIDGNITLFNPTAAKLSGYSQAEAMGKPYKTVLKFVHEDSGKESEHFVLQAMHGHVSAMKNHTALIHKNGLKTAVSDSAAPIRDAKGELKGVIVVFRDVSREQELDRAKTEFVSLASHQLRTPLSAINWYAELLLGGDAGPLSSDQQTYLREIFDGNQRMIELVNSLLDVSRLDLGKFSNKPVPNSIAEVVASLRKEFDSSIVTKHLHFKQNIAKTLPLVNAESKLIRIILQNLISNALKYTPDGGTVTVRAHRTSLPHIRVKKMPGNAYIGIEVQDNGYGIPVAQHGKIFDKLFRADNVVAKEVDGNGLGLYLVKQIVERLGGKIWFESQENHGTIFYVILPEDTKPA